jgi:ATP-dependent protease HslVU (ClpYQ) peptidase subunit
MTTIVYDHKNKIIAYDSRITAGSRVCTDTANKKTIDKRRGWIWFVSSSESDTRSFIEEFDEHKESEIDYDLSAIVIANGEANMVTQWDGVLKMVPLYYSDAIGSGSRWALAALDFGCSAVESVKYATRKDAFTGGKVNKFKLL